MGGGTGFNIEQMSKFLPVQDFFEAVYLVDLSPSLCEIARTRFARLGWDNVKVLCQDARSFRLGDEQVGYFDKSPSLSGQRTPPHARFNPNVGADLVTLSYSLSMIPDYYPVIDSLPSLLSPQGIIGVCDFYVQSRSDYQTRNYIGGGVNRHCNWISRVFWRTWFEADRVNLEAARRVGLTPI